MNLKIIFIFFFFVNPLLGRFQGSENAAGKIDTPKPIVENLIKSLLKETNDTSKIKLLNQISWNYNPSQPDEAIVFGDSALSFAKSIGWKKGEAEALLNIGDAYRYKGDIKNSLIFYKSALEVFNVLNDKAGLANSFASIANDYFAISDFPKSLENANRALKLFIEIDDIKGMAKIYGYMAIIYSTLKQYKNALEYFNNSLKICEKLDDSSSISIQLGNIGLAYSDSKEYKKALPFFERALKIADKIGDLFNYSLIIGNEGLAYTELGNYSEARRCFYISLKYAMQINDEYGIAYQTGNIGKLKLKMAEDNKQNKDTAKNKKTLNEAIGLLKKSIEKFKKLGVKDEQKNVMFVLSDAYKLAKQYKQAFETYSEAHKLQDSIFSDRNKKLIAELEIQQQLELKAKEIELLNNEKQYQTIYNKASVALAIVLLLISGYILYSYIKKRKDNLLLIENIRIRKAAEEALKNNEIELEKYQAHLEWLVNERTKNLESEILERSKVEKALKESEEKYRTILEFAVDAFFQGDLEGNLVKVNTKAIELTGYPRDELLGLNISQLFPTSILNEKPLRYDLLQQGETVITEREILTKNGKRLFIEMNSKKMPDGTFQSFFRDITERKTAEEILKRTEEQQSLILQSLPMVFYTTDATVELNTNWISEQVEMITGFLPKDFTENSEFWNKRIHPDDREDTLHEYNKVFSDGSTVSEYRWKCADGNYRWFSDRTVLVNDEHGSPHVVVGMWLDISERKQSEETILASEERFRLISNLTSDYLFSTIITEDGTAEPNWVMGAFENITGYRFDEYKKIGGWRKVVHPDDIEKDNLDFKKLFTNERVVSEIRTTHKNGNIIWLRTYAQPIWDKKANKLVGVYGAAQDITKRKRAEELLIESETKFRKIAEGTKAILFNTSTRGQFTYANQAASEILGIENKKLIGKFYLQFVYPVDRAMVHSYFQNQIKNNEKDRSLDFRYINTSGNVGWLSFLVNTLYKDGKVVGLTGVAQEITERKQTEDALRKSETQYRNLFETANDAIIIFEPESEIILEANSKACQVYDFKKEEFIGLSLKKLTLDLESEEQQVAMTMKNKGNKNFETRQYTRTGKIIHFLINASTIEYNGITAIFSINHDITERKIAEEKLLASELQFRSVWESSTDGMRITDEHGIMIMVNNAFCKLVEMEKSQLEGRPLGVIYKTENREHISEMHKIRLLTKTVELHFERELTLFNNKKYWFDVTNSYLEIENQPIMLLGIFRDITERKISEFELKKLSEAVEQSPASVLMTDIDGTIQYVNKSFSDISEYSFDEVIGKNSDMFSSDYNPKDQKKQLWETVLAGNAWRGEFLNKKKSGKLYWENVTIKAVKDKDGKIISILFVKEDITHKKKAEQEIQLLAHSIESISEGVSITDVDDQILFVNDAFVRIYGYDRQELIGNNIRIIRRFDETSDEMTQIISGTMRGGWKGEIVNKRKDGSLFPVYLSTSVVKDHNGIPIALIGVATDITETKKAREELVLAKERAEKANTLKTEFLAQMSHEIRSPMNVTLSFATLIRDELEESLTPELIECFKGIDYAGKRLIRTVDLILNMSEVQLGTYEPTWSDIDLVGDILDNVHIEYISLAKRKGLEFNFITSIKSAQVYADQNSLNQIFVNLVDNAIKYTNSGKVEIIVNTDDKNNYCVTIADTGIGISEDFKKNIFEPFMQEERGYSRRFEGNGLGLALVKKYCDMNNARINIESEKGKGSKFIVTFNSTLHKLQ